MPGARTPPEVSNLAGRFQRRCSAIGVGGGIVGQATLRSDREPRAPLRDRATWRSKSWAAPAPPPEVSRDRSALALRAHSDLGASGQHAGS